jgi:predicted nucleic-acid-binding protein
MIGFDTNLVVRLMVEDDVAQVRRARKLLEEAAERDELVLLSDIVLSELEWVLESAYKVPRQRILVALNALLADERFCFEDRHRVATALNLYQEGKGDLADYLISLRSEAAGARTTFTFDRNLSDDSRFTVVRS